MESQQQPQTQSHGSSYNIVQVAIMTIVIAVFAGYLVLWVMMPTNAYYLNWLPVLRAETTTTYFGPYQGATYLVFTFPVLFIAVLGCVYLHFGKKSRNNHNKGESGEHVLDRWKRPMIIKGLGIVSRIELAFFLMFIALVVWNFATYLHLGFSQITPNSAAKIGEKVWEMQLDTAALRLGLVGNIALSFLFLPVTRGSSVLPVLGLTSEASVKYHIWLGHIVMAFFTAHGLCYIIFWATTNELSQMLKWSKTGVSNVAGELSLLAGLVLWATTFPRIRRKIFELFFYTHHLYILFVFFFVLHVGISYACIMLPCFFLFMIDRYLRFLQFRRGVRLMSARVLPCETVELNFSKSKGLSYAPTSIMFLNVPRISKLQWHPFTITSSSKLECDKISVVIKGEGSWSKNLYQLLASPSSIDRIDVSIEGPYGPVSTDFLRHDLLVMISGGSGITPFISIISELLHTTEMTESKIPNILLISAFKNSNDLAMLDLILPISFTPSNFSNFPLQIEAYVTREKHQTTQEKINIRTIWFKPNPSDAPLTPILGQNNWLWLGAIISSSFIIYLIFIGSLTRFYIYPIDHNTNVIYSSPARNVLHVLFLCVGIAIAATGGFVWNKKKNGRENVQIGNVEGVTPMASPNTWYYNADRELESFPQEGLAKCIKVHYGERPDLKRLRLDNVILGLDSNPRSWFNGVQDFCSKERNQALEFLLVGQRH